MVVLLVERLLAAASVGDGKTEDGTRKRQDSVVAGDIAERRAAVHALGLPVGETVLITINLDNVIIDYGCSGCS